MVSPSEFVPVAERLGYAEDLDFWVLSKALEDFALMRSVAPDLMLHVNISPFHLSVPGAAEAIVRQIHASGINPSAIVLEITENSGDRANVLPANAEELRLGGVRIGMDDVSNAYNTLAFFARVPCDGEVGLGSRAGRPQ